MAGLLELGLILSAFGGGVFGAALGALNSFIFAGFLVIAGEAISVASGVGSFTGAIGFGTWFGPHIGFAGGAAAAAYAAKKGYVEGRDIITPLMKFKDPGVLFVGGLFGILGYFVNGFIAGVGTPTDTIALTVVISAIIKRVMFSDTGVIGTYNPEHGDSRWSPSEDIAWLPFQMHSGELLMIGLGVGLVSSKISLITGSPFIGFGIAAASLIILST